MSKRKQFTPEQKVAMVRRHLVENVPVSDLCDELGIHATQYYNWQKQLFENGEGAFARRPARRSTPRFERRRIMRIERGPDPGPFSTHSKYKSYLQPLFRRRCAYCLTPDDRNGGSDGMTVDHFRPTSRFSHLRLAWSNLYYSCVVCNSHYKRDHPTEEEEAKGHRFVDPCQEDPDGHFRITRDPSTGTLSRVWALTDPAVFTLRILRFNSRKSLSDFWRELDLLERRTLSRICEIEGFLEQLRQDIQRRGRCSEFDAIHDDYVRQLQQQQDELGRICSMRPFPLEA